MPKADATGLAPKKSADPNPSRTRFVGAGGLASVAAPASVPSFRQLPSADVSNHKINPISLVKPRSGGLGLQNAKSARPPLPGAPNGSFPGRDTGRAYTEEYPIPPARQPQWSAGQAAKESEKSA